MASNSYSEKPFISGSSYCHTSNDLESYYKNYNCSADGQVGGKVKKRTVVKKKTTPRSASKKRTTVKKKITPRSASKKRTTVKKNKNGSKRWIKLNNDQKINCSNFVLYQKKEKGLFGLGPENIKKIKGISKKKGYVYKHIDFNTFEDKETKIPDGYKSYKLKTDFINKYYCNVSKKILLKSNEEFKLIKKQNKGKKTYYIYDNGRLPFLVYVGKNKVSIYKQHDKYFTLKKDWSQKINNNKWMYIQLVKNYKTLKIFIGKSLNNKTTKDDGNTILLKIKNNNYIYIGPSILSFKLKNNIIKYVSDVTIGDISYPYAIDDKGLYYLIREEVVLKNVPEKYKKDPYEYENYTSAIPLKMKTIVKRLD